MKNQEITKAYDLPVEEINQQFQDFQVDLSVREKHLKLLPDFTHSMDEIIEIIKIKDLPTPNFLDNIK